MYTKAVSAWDERQQSAVNLPNQIRYEIYIGDAALY